MKRSFLIILSLLITTSILAQDIKETVPTTYDRSSLTTFYIDFPAGSHWKVAKSKVDSVMFSDKYDNNNYDGRFLAPSITYESAIGNMTEAIRKELYNANVGRKIIAKWYNRQPDGTMDMELVHQRGRFTATDADFLKAQTSKRGNAALEDYGNRLVNLSYILVIHISDIKTMGEAGFKGMKGWQAKANGYLYRINFNDEIRNAFYDTWIYDDDSEEVKEQKRRAFEQLDIPIEPVINKSLSITASQSENDKGLGLLVKSKSTDQLMQELVQKSYDETIYRIEMDVEEFKVKTSLYATRPLRAKIGLKEGLKTDYRFFVYEHVYNSKTGQAEPKRRGVIRAHSKSKIVDNRKEATGDTQTSRFYQVAGRKLEPGFTMQQQNDHGIEVSVGPEVGNVAGFYARVDYRLGRIIGVRSTFAYVEGGVDAADSFGESYGMLRYGGGLAKGLQLMRNIELRPYLGLGLEQTTLNISGTDVEISSLYVRAGANLALNLSHRFQVIGGAGLYQFGDATDEDGNTYGTWDSRFNRSGTAVLVGIKLGF
jgi:hypothetical protein